MPKGAYPRVVLTFEDGMGQEYRLVEAEKGEFTLESSRGIDAMGVEGWTYERSYDTKRPAEWYEERFIQVLLRGLAA